MDEERWLPVVGYEGWYEVSDLGRVRRRGKSAALTPVSNGNGYFRVNLSVAGKSKLKLIHRLVVEAFIGPVEYGYETNHISGVTTDNRLVNLEIVTRSENVKHAYRIGLASNQGENHPGSKLTDAMVREIRANCRTGIPNGRQTEYARRFGVSKRLIRFVLNGELWTHVQEEAK